ncbi:outer membrane beta-barrel protein [Maricaulis maris]|uniref:Opacity protein-like surface antigen n=1 Tax=Maricaulis maris TaxID=74318 RepID=A0A495DLI8_9PROT|nr:outer membrane beta-barrel protein [Maricaulis maris]RKR03796.1 opacity protein-like surface antigen [Maricaulis maris]
MLRTISVSVLAVLAMVGTASAQDDAFTLSGGYSQIQLDDFKLDAVTFRAGYDVNAYFGFEGQLDIGLGDDTVATCPAGAACLVADPSVGLDYGVGLFAIGRLPVGERFSLFARGGYVHNEFSTNFSYTGGMDANSFAWGAGAELALTQAGSLRFDYTRTDYDGFGNGDAYSLAYVHRFGG